MKTKEFLKYAQAYRSGLSEGLMSPALDGEACQMIRELCQACALGLDRIAKQKNLPQYPLAKLFIHTFETILEDVAEDE